MVKIGFEHGIAFQDIVYEKIGHSVKAHFQVIFRFRSFANSFDRASLNQQLVVIFNM